jgi:hypothetical protein
MHYVILRDDDTNAFTPVECLERLYRPFLDRGLPVNLATIPCVRTDAKRADGRPEGFLFGGADGPRHAIPISRNSALVQYLHENAGYRVVQHGYHHSLNEFDSDKSRDIRKRLEHGADLFETTGFGRPRTFVAPYDRYSRTSLQEVARRFRVFSTGWFELRRLPASWWTFYMIKKMLRRPHWRMGNTLLLSHPGCLLSRDRPCSKMFDAIKTAVGCQQITVLVTHWWEYYRDGRPDEPFIQVLHETANWLADQENVRAVSFDDLLVTDVQS